jgi:hypothetical protein
VLAVTARLRSETGVSLIVVAIALFSLIGISVFVLDQGVFYLARARAQNAADAGALSGAIARAFDDPADPPEDDGPAAQAAQAGVLMNPSIQGGVYGAELPANWHVCPGFVLPASGCVTINAHLDGTNGSTMTPTFLLNMFGITGQLVRATATAQAAAANASDCLRPFGVPDLWDEWNMPPSADEFKRYKTNPPNKGSVLPAPDIYRDPWDADPSGYTLDQNWGTELRLAYGPGGGTTRKGWYMPLDVPQDDGGSPGANGVGENILGCNGVAVPLRSTLPIEPGAQVGPIRMIIQALINQDPGADWDGDSVEGSCAPVCATYSPRIITLALFDPDIYQASDTTNSWPQCSGGGQCVTVVGFLGFFVDRMESGDVIGYLVRVPGVLVEGGPEAPAAGAFATSIRLVR